MNSVHSIIREELCSLVAGVWADITPDVFDMDCPGAEVSAPLGFRPGPCDIWWQEELSRMAEAEPPMILGARLLRGISAANGHVLFHISDEAYSSIIFHIIKNYPKPQMPDNTDNIISYAAARMLMLSRKGGIGCPDPFKQGLWLCLCIEGFQGKKREAVRRRAAEALLNAMEGLNAAERDAVRELSGGCGACAARLLMINPQ